MEGARLVRLLEKLVAYGKILEHVERRGTPRRLAELLLRGEVKDAEAFTDKAPDAVVGKIRERLATAQEVDGGR